MTRTEFEVLRDLPGKTIRGDIRFARRKNTAPSLVAEDVPIENDLHIDVRLTIAHNPEVGSTTLNVHIPGVGPICRLDADGPPHRPAGRTHKHALQTERCPDRNLTDKVVDRPDLSKLPVRRLFAEFCAMGSVAHEGTFEAPDEQGGAT